jgi:hypothetical protein
LRQRLKKPLTFLFNLKKIIMTKEEILTGTNTTIEKIKSQLAGAFKKIGAISIIIMAIGSGFVIGYYYNTLFNKMKETDKGSQVFTDQDISLWTDGKNNTLIMDKKTGKPVMILDETVTNVLFNQTANQMYKEVTKTP